MASRRTAAQRAATAAGAGAGADSGSDHEDASATGVGIGAGDISIEEAQAAVQRLNKEHDALEAAVEAEDKATREAVRAQQAAMDLATSETHTEAEVLKALMKHAEKDPAKLKAGTPLRAWAEARKNHAAAKEQLASCKAELEKLKGMSFGLAKAARLKELDEGAKHEVGEWYGMDQDGGQVVATAALLKASEVADKVSALREEVKAQGDTLTNKIDAVNDNVHAGTAKLDSADSKLEAVASEVSTIRNDVNTTNDKVDAATAKLESTDSKVEAVASEVSAMKTHWRTTQVKVDEVASEVSEMKTQVDDRLSDLKTTMDGLLKLLKPMAAREAAARFLGTSTLVGAGVPAANVEQLREFVLAAATGGTAAGAGAGASSGDGMRTRLLYRMSRDGKSEADFHRLCDGQGMTLVLCRSRDKGCVFGGFTTLAWSSPSSDTYKAAPGSFLFRLHSAARPSAGAERTGTILKPDHVVKHHSGYGPVFGHGHDLILGPGASATRMSRAEFQNSTTFKLPAGYSSGAAFMDDTAKARHTSDLVEVEVWQVQV